MTRASTRRAGNAQLNNYGRGGVEGDPMRVELQDNFLGGSRNNANMSTPSDGIRPRMQMYTWFGPQAATLTLTPGGNVPVGAASFGPFNFDISAQVALANDGAGASPTDACEALAGFVPGRIALADRGTCSFTVKARNAQAAGAVGILIANNVASATPPGLGGTGPARHDWRFRDHSGCRRGAARHRSWRGRFRPTCSG